MPDSPSPASSPSSPLKGESKPTNQLESNQITDKNRLRAPNFTLPIISVDHDKERPYTGYVAAPTERLPNFENNAPNPFLDASVVLTKSGQLVDRFLDSKATGQITHLPIQKNILSPFGEESVFIAPSLPIPNTENQLAGQTVSMAYQTAMTNSPNFSTPTNVAGMLPLVASGIILSPAINAPQAVQVAGGPQVVQVAGGPQAVQTNNAPQAVQTNNAPQAVLAALPFPIRVGQIEQSSANVSSSATSSSTLTNSATTNSAQILYTQDLVKIYQKRTVVDHISLSVQRGEVVGILGPNGAGKTTTFRMVVGLIKPDAGQIFLDQKNISHLPMYERARLGVGYLPQEPTIFARLSVEDNLQIILEHLSITKQEAKDRLETVLAEMRIEFLRKAKAGTLSGGERRRLEIARSLLNSPAFLMLDEPFAAVDPKVVESLQDLIVSLSKRNIGILITDHKPRETLSITNRAYIISKGKILRHGPSSELINDKEVRDLYLGDRFIAEGVSPATDQDGSRAEVLQHIENYEYEEAIPVLHKLIMANPKDLHAYFQRGFCFYRMHDYTSARLDFYRIWQINPDFPNVRKMLLKCQEKLGIKGDL